MSKWRAVWKIQLHRTGPWWLLGLVVLSGYITVAEPPLGKEDPWAGLLGLTLGVVLAFRLFTDEEGTSPFLLSRPLSRAQQFWYRWALGFGLLVVLLVFMAVRIRTGARAAFQSFSEDAMWYPMVRPYEIAVLWPIALGSLIGYQAGMFLILRTRALEGKTPGRWWQAQTAARSGVLTIIVLAMLTSVAGTIVTRPPEGWAYMIRWGVPAYLVILLFATTLAARHSFTRMEVSA
jgi:hypothetical protein